jgi:hypothetical protein
MPSIINLILYYSLLVQSLCIKYNYNKSVLLVVKGDKMTCCTIFLLVALLCNVCSTHEEWITCVVRNSELVSHFI